MEGGSLFNPGFLGGSFLWWIGQIADDSTWRDNILPGKFENKESIPGWSRRYKVRIIGLHDQGENEIPSDQLPWAQVMYPTTAGGGQTNAGQTANLRQGNIVFGFFLDGQEQQVPVIMGVMGNNAQTSLSKKIGNSRVTNTTPGSLATSGFADGKVPKKGSAKEKVPDDGLVVGKPKTSQQAKECATVPSGVKTNSFGLRSDLPLSSQQFADSQSARAEAEQRGLTGVERENLIQQRVAEGIKNRCREANSSASPSQPGATKENVDAVHELSVADVARSVKYKEKIVLLKPDPDAILESAMKGMQTEIDNFVQKIDKYLSSFSSYIDAASSKISDIRKIMRDLACQIAKYMKILFDRVMEYVLKILNEQLSKAVSAMPSSMRYMFADVKEILTQLLLQLYGKLINGLCDLIEGLLAKTFNIGELEDAARSSSNDSDRKKPKVPVCYAEDLAGQVFSASRDQINEFNQTTFDNVNAFLSDIEKQLAGIGGSLSDVKNQIGSISGNMTSALNFVNVSINVFGFELEPEKAVSDFYQFAAGSLGQKETQLPSIKSVADSSVQPTVAPSKSSVPFIEPTKNQPDLDFDSPVTDAERNAVRRGEIVDNQGNVIGNIQ